MHEELDRVRRAAKRELVVYQPPSQALMRKGRGVRIPIQRPGGSPGA
jgi:hypothetical protein